MFAEMHSMWHMHTEVSSSEMLSAHLNSPDSAVAARLLKQLFLTEVQEVSSAGEVTVTFSKVPV